tara:strand:+ start:1024 stop:1140 length:117 start_codon:yes stop_codon:yes gene_type:complete
MDKSTKAAWKGGKQMSTETINKRKRINKKILKFEKNYY